MRDVGIWGRRTLFRVVNELMCVSEQMKRRRYMRASVYSYILHVMHPDPLPTCIVVVQLLLLSTSINGMRVGAIPTEWPFRSTDTHVILPTPCEWIIQMSCPRRSPRSPLPAHIHTSMPENLAAHRPGPSSQNPISPVPSSQAPDTRIHHPTHLIPSPLSATILQTLLPGSQPSRHSFPGLTYCIPRLPTPGTHPLALPPLPLPSPPPRNKQPTLLPRHPRLQNSSRIA